MNTYGSSTTVQASAAISADAFSGGAQTQLDNSSTGADWLLFEIDVTAAPSSNAVAAIYEEAEEQDGAGDSAERLVGSIAILSAGTDKYSLPVMVVPNKAKYKIKAINYGFTAALTVIPVVISG